jgi:NADH-quinone oxidoreductase subunit F
LKRIAEGGARSFSAYTNGGGYRALESALARGPDELVREINISGLRGRGGAGFPTGKKWRAVLAETSPEKFVVANADEGDPGAYIDRFIIEDDPHALIEGMAIAGYAVGAGMGYIYLRAEYPRARTVLEEAIAEARLNGVIGNRVLGTDFSFDIEVVIGHGSYVCGEETALLNSIEGRRPEVRARPPYPTSQGLWGKPTVINNVETLASVPPIILGGAEWFANLGTPKNGGTRLFCLGGHLNKPGVYELPMGYNLKKMIYDVGGGIPNGRKLKAVVPGGSSCPLLTADEVDVPMDFDSLAKAGSMLGSGGLVVADDTTCMVKFALRIMKFYQHESCGWCIPCREGTDWLKKTLTRFHAGGGIKKDIDNIQYLSENMLGRTFCPLGDAAALPTISIVKKFRREFEDHLEGKPCPFEKAGTARQLPVFARIPLVSGVRN